MSIGLQASYIEPNRTKVAEVFDSHPAPGFNSRMLLRSGVLVCLLAAIAHPAVQRLYVKERSDIAGGASFGSAGPYERIAATAVFRIDPKLKQNRGIVDLDLAPTDPEGLVEFTADVLILKPRDPAKGNGTALIDVPNRGRMSCDLDVQSGLWFARTANLAGARRRFSDAAGFHSGFGGLAVGYSGGTGATWS